MPDIKEITDMANKFFGDMKRSICEIVEDYKKSRTDRETEQTEKQAAPPNTDKPVNEPEKKPEQKSD